MKRVSGLSANPAEYELLTPLPGEHVQVRFSGPYKGNAIVWHLQLMTVAFYFKTRGRPEQDDAPHSPRQFIYIEECGEDNNVIVAMNVPVIDEPTLKKAMIMIRKYKRLRPGWHFWGAGDGS